MCWNAAVSLNTFLFSGFVLLLIMYNNIYTQYKVYDIYTIWDYLFFMSFIFMQLIEYFIWINIKNPFNNTLFTTLANILLLIQPIATMMLITNTKMKKYMLILYFILVIPFALYKIATQHIYSDVSSLGHLNWHIFINNKINILQLLWLFFFLFPLFYEGKTYTFMFGLLTLLVIIYTFFQDNSMGSMWCWIVNTIMIYYAVYLLFYLPFYK